jgi:hypothetical protein
MLVADMIAEAIEKRSVGNDLATDETFIGYVILEA